jgi:ribosomal protein S18 acetylase RimI-like enzyme
MTAATNSLTSTPWLRKEDPMQDLSVRPYREADEADVIALWKDAFPEERAWNEPRTYIARKLLVQGDLFLVGEVDGRLVATVVGGFDGVRGWVYHLAVAGESRRRGFGAAMMRALEARLASAGCPKVNLQVLAHNAGVVAFYERLGYAVEERVSMGKPLSGRRLVES